MNSDQKFRIVLESPPPGIDYALQEGKGAGYKPVQIQRSAGKDLRFEFSTSIKEAGVSAFRLGGPFVQGSPKEPFVYINIGVYAGQANTEWARRLKIPLTGITHQVVGAKILEARVEGTGKDGGPNCATAKDFDGWKPVTR